ncbi:MAG: hypothetical protein E7648_06280 [Ruminococcaceae bacterium]|nr:hypothetical protein [Oscillospiraceae bacterium]
MSNYETTTQKQLRELRENLSCLREIKNAESHMKNHSQRYAEDLSNIKTINLQEANKLGYKVDTSAAIESKIDRELSAIPNANTASMVCSIAVGLIASVITILMFVFLVKALNTFDPASFPKGSIVYKLFEGRRSTGLEVFYLYIPHIVLSLIINIVTWFLSFSAKG